MEMFRDFRDKLLLDLEKRIYNNPKQEYAENIVDIADFVPSKTRGTGISRYQIAKTITPEFARWLETVGNPDYVDNSYFKRGNSFTYNYSLTFVPIMYHCLDFGDQFIKMYTTLIVLIVILGNV